jgi:archaellum component FlaC
VEERLQKETSALRALESLVKSGFADEAKERAKKLSSMEETMTSFSSAFDGLRMESEQLAARMAAAVSRLDCIDKVVAEEVDNRIGGDKTLSKELGDQLSLEAQRLHDTVLREMRERMDGQRTLREEMQVQQQALMRLSPRIDEAFIELQAELPRISQDLRSQKSAAEQMSKTIADAATRVEQCEKGLADEVGTRSAAMKSISREIRESIASEASRTDTQLLATQKKLQQEILALVESTGQAAISTK